MSFWTQPMSRGICSSFMSVIEGPMRNRILTAKGQIASRSYSFQRRALCDIADNLTHRERMNVAGQLVCHVIANLPKEAP